MKNTMKMGALAIALLALAGCEEKKACGGKGVVATISGNHGHEIAIPKDAVERGIGGTYPVTGGDHKHAVPLKDEHLAKLKAGETATTRTTSVESHVHEVTLSCAE